MSSITYYNPNDEFCLEVRQWFLDNPQDDSDYEYADVSSGQMNPFYGKKHTEETKKEMSYAAKNRTEEQKQNLSIAAYKRKKGWKHSEETIKKMSETAKKQNRKYFGRNAKLHTV